MVLAPFGLGLVIAMPAILSGHGFAAQPRQICGENADFLMTHVAMG
jgi:hypothetical protein